MIYIEFERILVPDDNEKQNYGRTRKIQYKNKCYTEWIRKICKL